ncbi:hypothetical protein ASZ90_004131 [hydrocarbon metagenome]|uniref:Uncharacterized protein n=1 Tax=hydrocarbon metagenome TaxID=938273 RepID=A0A0W8FZ20_9ZZZZ
MANENIMKLLSVNEVEEIFDNKKMLKNIDYIFERSVERE